MSLVGGGGRSGPVCASAVNSVGPDGRAEYSFRMTDAYQNPRPAAVPDKPALDGLEAVWSVRWEADQVYRFDRSRPRGRGLLDRHAAAHRVRVAARRARVLLHPHRHHRPLPADDRQGRSSTRSAGTTTGCRPSGGCRTSTGCGATRRCPTTRASPAPRAGRARPSMPVSRRNFIELCERLTALDERAFEETWRRIGLSVDWSLLYTTISDDEPAGLAAGVPAQPGAGRGVPGRGADAVGRHVPDRGRAGRARGPRVRRARSTGSPSTRPTGRRCGSRRRGPELLPACVALVAHPDDARYQPLFGVDGADAGVRRAGAGARAPAGRAGQGVGHRDGVHLRRPDRRDLVAGARPADRGRSSGGTGGCCPTPPAGVPAAPYEELAGKTVFSRPRADGRAAAGERRPRRRAAAGHPAGEVLRAGRQAARDRHLGPVVHPERRARRNGSVRELLDGAAGS